MGQVSNCLGGFCTHASVALLFTAFTVFAGFPVAATGQSKQRATPCGKETTTAAMRACQNHRYQRAERALDSMYTRLMRQLDETGKEKLQNAQSAWLQFRQTNADFQADIAREGTVAPLIRVTVMADMTEARARELRKSLQH